jgi:hypothetical protein
MNFRLLLFCCLLSTCVQAQTRVGLVAYYSFDGNLNDNTGNTSNTGIAVGTPAFTCGVVNQALLLDGANDQVRIPNTANVSGEFGREDFTVSFYFKPIGTCSPSAIPVPIRAVFTCATSPIPAP